MEIETTCMIFYGKIRKIYGIVINKVTLFTRYLQVRRNTSFTR